MTGPAAILTFCVVAHDLIAPTKRSSMGANNAGDGIGWPK
jgi:hypothetical protein